MSDKPWKKSERLVAAAIGGTRDTFAFASGDVRHSWIAADAKRRKQYTFNAARSDIAHLAHANPGKLPIVVHFDQPGRGYKVRPVVVMWLEDFRDWFGDLDFVPKQEGAI